MINTTKTDETFNNFLYLILSLKDPFQCVMYPTIFHPKTSPIAPLKTWAGAGPGIFNGAP